MARATLADRFLEFTGAVSKREMKEQLRTTWSWSRGAGNHHQGRAVACATTNRGRGVRTEPDRHDPGTWTSSMQVSRSLACCEGALLLVDVSQGVEAQTLANATPR